MKKMFKFFKSKKTGDRKKSTVLQRDELEKKVVEGAKKAVKEYRRVFERLAEYDRT